MARAVAAAAYVVEGQYDDFRPMPSLSLEKARELYIASRGQPTLDRYNDEVGLFHGGKYNSRLVKERPPFYHKPAHDVESVFWVLIRTLLRVVPAGSDIESSAPSNTFKMAYECLDRHSIVQQREHAAIQDSQTPILGYRDTVLQGVLPLQLGSLAPLLEAMIDQVRPEYAYLQPPPAEDHLHEAFQRLLLEHIVSMDDPVPLDPELLRPIDVPSQKPQAAPQRRPDTSEDSKVGSTSKAGSVRISPKRGIQRMEDPESPSRKRSKHSQGTRERYLHLPF